MSENALPVLVCGPARSGTTWLTEMQLESACPDRGFEWTYG